MVERQIHRLKLIKRQMYGKASFDLLRLRVLHRLIRLPSGASAALHVCVTKSDPEPNQSEGDPVALVGEHLRISAGVRRCKCEPHLFRRADKF